MVLTVNEFGLAKAEAFRRHFNLPTIVIYGDGTNADACAADVHDYLHTVIGARPEWERPTDELAVLELDEAIRGGIAPLPRGLVWR